MMYFLEFTRLDYDDYAVGAPWGRVGPFATREEASEWAEEVYGIPYFYVRDGLGGHMQLVSLDMTSPADEAARLAQNRAFNK